MKVSQPDIKFTVIIPTRERADTLRWSLKTCTTQNYERFEIIVSDNFSQDTTRQVVEDSKDSRIRYINTGRRVSMTGNYEFALARATGDYVCVIGDDDGLMPNALLELNEFLKENETAAITWKKPFYFWENWHEVERRNTLHLKLNTEAKEFDARERLQALFTFDPTKSFHFSELASLYHGFIKTDIINRLRTRNGRFFYSSAPDVYSSVAVTSVIEKFRHSARPYTMHGISRHSTGFASDNTKAMHTFLSEEDNKEHPKIKIAPNSASICATECLLQVREHIREAAPIDFDVKKLVETAIREAVSLPPEVHHNIVGAVEHIGETFQIKDYVNETIAKYPNVKAANVEFLGYDFLRRDLILKLKVERVKNIYDATIVCKEILDNRSRIFYFVETIRYLLKFTKNFGVKNSLQKALHRAFSTQNSAS